MEAVQPGDWAVFDYLDPIWGTTLPGWYTQVFLGLDETEVTRRRCGGARSSEQNALSRTNAVSRGTPLFDRLRDYTYLNPEYKRPCWRLPRINAKAHVLCMASRSRVKDNDDKGHQEALPSIGARPASQKGSPVVGEHCAVPAVGRRGQWTMTTAKGTDQASTTSPR